VAEEKKVVALREIKNFQLGYCCSTKYFVQDKKITISYKHPVLGVELGKFPSLNEYFLVIFRNCITLLFPQIFDCICEFKSVDA